MEITTQIQLEHIEVGVEELPKIQFLLEDRIQKVLLVSHILTKTIYSQV